MYLWHHCSFVILWSLILQGLKPYPWCKCTMIENSPLLPAFVHSYGQCTTIYILTRVTVSTTTYLLSWKQQYYISMGSIIISSSYFIKTLWRSLSFYAFPLMDRVSIWLLSWLRCNPWLIFWYCCPLSSIVSHINSICREEFWISPLWLL